MEEINIQILQLNVFDTKGGDSFMQIKRNQYFDFLKGIAILMVIGIHTFFISGGFISFHEYLKTGIRQVLNCAVPIFLACSGFFLANKKLDTKAEIRAFYKQQISRVYIPCLLWSMPWLAIHILGGGNVALGVLKLFLCGFSVYYFVLLVIQYYLLLPAIQVIKTNGGGYYWLCQ